MNQTVCRTGSGLHCVKMLFLSFCLPCSRWCPLSRDQHWRLEHLRNPLNIQQSERFRWPNNRSTQTSMTALNTGHYFVLCCGRGSRCVLWCDKTWGDSLCFHSAPRRTQYSCSVTLLQSRSLAFLYTSHSPMGFLSLIPLSNIIPIFIHFFPSQAVSHDLHKQWRNAVLDGDM